MATTPFDGAGNSGGPAFSSLQHGRVAGVAFSKLVMSDNIGCASCNVCVVISMCKSQRNVVMSGKIECCGHHTWHMHRYIIPHVVVKHFMEEFEQHHCFRGCCAVGFRWQVRILVLVT